jgi:ATP-binding cassette subfamily B protein
VSSRVTNDVTLIEAVMGGTLLYALRMAITLVGCVAMLFFTSAKLTVLALLGMPLGAAADRAHRLARCASSRARCRTAWPTSPATSTRRIHEVRTVQAFATSRARARPSAERVEAVFRWRSSAPRCWRCSSPR